MKIFNRDIDDTYRALDTVIDIYTGHEHLWYSGNTTYINNAYLITLKKASKRDHGIELDLVSGGKKMTINITITI